MALQNSSTTNRLERFGLQSMSSETGLCVLGSILRSSHGSCVGVSMPVLAAAPIQWNRFLQLMPSVPAFCSEVGRDAMAEDGGGCASQGQTGFASQLAKLSEKERTEQVQTYLTGVVGDVLGREVGGDEPRSWHNELAEYAGVWLLLCDRWFGCPWICDGSMGSPAHDP